jgi:hypothetical protein
MTMTTFSNEPLGSFNTSQELSFLYAPEKSKQFERERRGIPPLEPLLPRPSGHRISPCQLSEYLEDRTPKEKHLSIFKKKLTPAKSEMQGVFFLSRLPSEMRRWGEFLAAAGGEMRSD